jgi:hypothetical protein
MSSTYSVTRDQIITQALRKLGVLELGVAPDTDTVTNASTSLNLLIKQMSTEGLKLWKNSELIIPVTASTTTYILGGASSVTMYDSLAPTVAITDRPLKAIQAFYRNVSVSPNIDVPLQLLSKQEYLMLGSKGSTGVTNSIFYDVKALQGILYVYLTPDTYTATNLQVHMVAQMPLNDVSAATDVPDFPNEWMNTLVWNLADQLAIEYGVPMNYRQEIAQRAAAYKSQLTDWDVEAPSTFFQPDYRSMNVGKYR